MIDSLKIKGFKLFRNLELPKLARLNLFVGTNNTGKSCLLEAVRLYVGVVSGDLSVLRDLVRSRDGDWEVNVLRRDLEMEDGFSGLENPIRFLFNDFHYEKSPSAVIEIEPDRANELRLQLSLALYHRVQGKEGSTSLWKLVERNALIETSETSDVREMLGIRFGKTRRQFNLGMLWRRPQFLPSIPPPLVHGAVSRPITVVGTSSIAKDDVATLWDKVVFTPQREKVLDALRLIEPKIEALAFVGDSSRVGLGRRIPIVEIRGSGEGLPLRSMGDGLTRLFHIALAMVNAQQGVILIDEFENGLYWEVLERLWPVIFKMAEELNVQVFATTHSSDCIKGFADAWKNDSSSGMMYRLERTKSSVNAFPLPVQNLQDALAANVEVR